MNLGCMGKRKECEAFSYKMGKSDRVLSEKGQIQSDNEKHSNKYLSNVCFKKQADKASLLQILNKSLFVWFVSRLEYCILKKHENQIVPNRL